MNKQDIKQIAKKMFIAGKNNLADRLFDEYFEDAYKEVKEDDGNN